MAVNTRGPIDPRWINYNLGVDKAFRFASVEIFNPNSKDNVYNPTTNTWTHNQDTVWIGKARIQPRNASATAGTNGNIISAIDPGARQIVEVNIGLKENQLMGSNGAMPDIRPGFKMVVTDSPFDENLVNFDFTVRSVVNSSNPWHRQLLCEVNQELNPNNG